MKTLRTRNIGPSLILACLLLSSVQAQTANSKLLQNLLDLPAPAPPGAEVSAEIEERPADFYNAKNVPPDDAPIGDLLDYWSRQNSTFDEFRFNIKPSKESLRRILDAAEENPELLVGYLKLLSADQDTADSVKRIYQNQMQLEKLEPYWFSQVRGWLRNNSDLFINELYESAKEVKDQKGYITSQDDFRNLARVDWERAQPLVERMERDQSQPASYALAKWVRYQRALDRGDTGDADRYREELKKIVENKSMTPGVRDLAMDALVLGGDFQGRDEWYLSLLSDETLLEMQNNGYTGLTTLPRHSPNSRENWIPKMMELIEKGSPAARSSAIRNLMQILGEGEENRKAALKILLPWLSDVNWAKESRDNERTRLIEMIGEIDLPESVPGLLAVVTNEDGENRVTAAKALVRYKPAEAIPVLRNALQSENNSGYRTSLIEALIGVGGLSADEQMSALEIYAKLISTEEGQAKLQAYLYEYYEEEEAAKPLPVEIIIGKFVAEQETPADALVMRVVERLKILRKSNPAVAVILQDILQKWSHRLADLELLNWVANGKADVEVILNLLAKRTEMRERVPNELAALRQSEGLPRGIAAVISNDKNEMRNIIVQSSAETQIAALAAARLIRTKLPIEEVGKLLNTPNKMLALAAERYLESEDSPEARSSILAKYPNEARILGARQAFVPNEKGVYESEALNRIFQSVIENDFYSIDTNGLHDNEDRLRTEIKENPDLIAVYALIENRAEGHRVIRVFKDKITFTFYEDAARFRQRNLTREEYEAFYSFLIEKQIDNIIPPNGVCPDCMPGEFIMFGRGGGRRIFFQNAEFKPPPFDKLTEFFEEFSKSELRLHYRLADKIEGLEVLLADDKFPARAVWTSGNDLRVLVEDIDERTAILEDLARQDRLEDAAETINREQKNTVQRQRRAQAAYRHFSWRNIENGKPGQVKLAQPTEVPYLSSFPPRGEWYEVAQNPEPATFGTRAGSIEIRTRSEYESGLFKVTAGGAPVLIKEGNYHNALISPDGKWVVAAASNEENYDRLTRINLTTAKETKINLTPADSIHPLAFVASHGKFLVLRTKEENPYRDNDQPGRINPSPKVPEYYLVDAVTGVSQPVKGEFRPLQQQTFRALQPTGMPDEFWAAIYDKDKKTTQIGRYSDRTFNFKPIMQIPAIELDSMDIWISAAEKRVYFVYSGHLLALPLPKQF